MLSDVMIIAKDPAKLVNVSAANAPRSIGNAAELAYFILKPIVKLWVAPTVCSKSRVTPPVARELYVFPYALRPYAYVPAAALMLTGRGTRQTRSSLKLRQNIVAAASTENGDGSVGTVVKFADGSTAAVHGVPADGAATGTY